MERREEREMVDWTERRVGEEGRGLWKGKEVPRGRQRKRVEKVGGEEKCGKERVKSGGNSSCCLSTLLLQVSNEFLLFCLPDAYSSISIPYMFLSGGLSPFLY